MTSAGTSSVESTRSSSEDSASPTPWDADSEVATGRWEVEPIYYSVGGKTDRQKRGKAFRSRATGDLVAFQSHDDVLYRPLNSVYVEVNAADPYLVGTISSFKTTKRELAVVLTRFYRPDDVPDVSLSLVAAERGESGECGARPREIFNSETSVTYPISSLRGKCKVKLVKDVGASRECDLLREDAFFSCLTFNTESNRLASESGEIRIGPSHQAKLPPEATSSVAEDADRDELLWRPGQISQDKELTYIKLARTFRMCLLDQGRMHETERHARTADLLHDDAITTLHRCGYLYADAIHVMNANDRQLLMNEDSNLMTPEDTKKFGRGIRTFGKNFTRISRELLPQHGREQLVAFYYLWKKTADATKPKAMSRSRNQSSAIKRGKTAQTPRNGVRPPSTDLLDYASASEAEVAGLDEVRRAQYACHHCYSTHSRDWHHAGRDRQLLCTDCRLFFKKYGQLRPVDRPSTVPPCLFKRSPSETDDNSLEDPGVRTRAGKKEKERTSSAAEQRSPSAPHDLDGHRNGGSGGGKGGKHSKRKKSTGGGQLKKRKDEEDVKEELKDKEEEEEQDQDEQMKEAADSSSPPVLEKAEEEPPQSCRTPSAETTHDEAREGQSREEDDEDITVIHSSTEEVSIGSEVDPSLQFPSGQFVRRLVRVGMTNSCSRTDLFFRLSETVKAAKERRLQLKEQEEAAKAASLVAPQPRRADPPLPPPSTSSVCQPPLHLMNGTAPHSFPVISPELLMMTQHGLFHHPHMHLMMRPGLNGAPPALVAPPPAPAPPPLGQAPPSSVLSAPSMVIPPPAAPPEAFLLQQQRAEMDMRLQLEAMQQQAAHQQAVELANRRFMEHLQLVQLVAGQGGGGVAGVGGLPPSLPPLSAAAPLPHPQFLHPSEMMRRLQQESFRPQ